MTEVKVLVALPVLWSLLENKALPVRSASVRPVLTRLASALCQGMGTKLKKCAASQTHMCGKDSPTFWAGEGLMFSRIGTQC